MRKCSVAQEHDFGGQAIGRSTCMHSLTMPLKEYSRCADGANGIQDARGQAHERTEPTDP